MYLTPLLFGLLFLMLTIWCISISYNFHKDGDSLHDYVIFIFIGIATFIVAINLFITSCHMAMSYQHCGCGC